MRLIRDHGWTDDVDLVQGGRIDLLFTDQEVEEAQRDREAASRAGWPLDGVVTLAKDEVEAVRARSSIANAHRSRCRLMSDVWCTLSSGEDPGAQSLAA